MKRVTVKQESEFNNRQRKSLDIVAMVYDAEGDLVDGIFVGEGNHRQALSWAQWRANTIAEEYPTAVRVEVYAGNAEKGWALIATMEIAEDNGSEDNDDAVTNFDDLSINATNIVLYAKNTRHINDKIEWLQKCVIKKMHRGVNCTVEYLCECSTLKKIVSEAIKEYKRDGGEAWSITAADRRQARQYLSYWIMEEAKCIAKQTVNA